MYIFKKPIIVFFALVFVLYAASVIIASVNFNKLPKELVLQFDNLKGVKSFGTKLDIVGILSVSFLMIAINFFLGAVVFHKEKVLSYILVISTLLISIFNLIIISLIVSIN